MKAPYKRTTVADASRHTTPEPDVKSLSHPRSASEVGCPEAKNGMSSSRTKLRKGFTENTGTVSEPYDCPEELCDSSEGMI
jgi:hypothetical protein